MTLSTASALVQRDGKLFRESITVPSPSDHQVLIKVSHVAQNPTDVQSFDSKVFGDGAVLGCDFVGTVEKVGLGVKRLTVGTVVAGLIWGGEIKGLGGYSEYTVADEKICFPLPEGTDPAQAATIPLAACTAWLALFSKDCLDINRQNAQSESVLIWGGSSSVGQFAIQLAALYGMNVVTTCSPKHHGQALTLGAKHVFDYRDADVVDKIRAVVPDLGHVFDTIGNDTSSVTASKAIRENGGGLCTVRPGKQFCENTVSGVKVTDVLVWTAFLKDHRYGDFHWPANKEDHELAAELFEKLPSWLVDGRIKPNQPKVFQGGLADVMKGFQEYRDGSISNYKIVYKLEDASH